MSWIAFQDEFRTEEDCFQWLTRTRWPGGFICPRCGSEKSWQISTRKLLKCAGCRYQVSVTAGTIFHKTRVPLRKWFMLIFRMATSKTGVSINEMKRELEIGDYKTIWTMAHKVRKAMADRDAQYQLAGLVEVDEGFFGPTRSGKRGRGAQGKELVIVAVSTYKDKEGKERPGFAHAFVAKNAKAETIEELLCRLEIPEQQTRATHFGHPLRRVEKLSGSKQEHGYRPSPSRPSRPEGLHETAAVDPQSHCKCQSSLRRSPSGSFSQTPSTIPLGGLLSFQSPILGTSSLPPTTLRLRVHHHSDPDELMADESGELSQ